MSRQQLKLFDTVCYGPDFTPRLNEYCGFRSNFTKHDWCEKHYVGQLVSIEPETLQRCSCLCHRRNK